VISVKNLNKYYNKNKSNEIHVINDVSLELPSVGLVSFLGASGSGKTTLLNVIGGLDKAKGEISYDSFEMKKYEMSKIDKYRNENFGYVFQGYNLLLTETVYDNLRIALELIDVYDKDEVSGRIEYALKSVGMYKYRKKKASQLSGGQQQRVAIARALVKQCKVIIADEPTGNLDSGNAVEVMNILKSISKKTLVLLVTHNESLAKFYSDTIYRLSDGRIVDRYENLSSESLDNRNDNVIYLKDMSLTESESERVSVKLYAEGDESIELEIVERNNTFYIRSNRNIKLIEGSNIKLLDEHYKPIEKSDTEKYDYDDSFFDNTAKKRNVIEDVLASLKQSFLSFIRPTKKIRMIYCSMALIGVLFAFCFIAFANAIKIDTDKIGADEHYSTLSNGSRYGFFDDSEDLTEALKNGYVSSVQITYSTYKDFAKKLNYVESERFIGLYNELYFNEQVNDLVWGRAPAKGEIAVSVGVAEELFEEFSDYCDSYDDLFELSVGTGYMDERIVGVVDNPQKIIYSSIYDYVEGLGKRAYIEDDLTRYYEYEKKYDTYEIVMGRDLTDMDAATVNILISDQYPGYEELLNTDTPYGFVVGVYQLKDTVGSPEEIIINRVHTENVTGSYVYSYQTEDYVIVEGREPEADNECLVSTYSSLSVGEEFEGYKVVGRYNAATQLLRANVLVSVSALSLDEYYSTQVFIVEDEDGIKEQIKGGEFTLKSMYQSAYDQEREYNDDKMTLSLVLGMACLIASSVMVFFLMRSRMLGDIYTIGVYRTLGSSKIKIYLKYLTDTVVMVTLTSFVTYLTVMLGYLTAIDSINEYFALDMYSRGVGVPILGVFVMYLVNVLFGLAPIFTLLRKTPSEIIAKYDI
jgi:ABC-type lipoprotein export system ATPase subunit